MTREYASRENSSVMLTLMPAAIASSTAFAPSAVPGILIMTFGRSTVAQSRCASAIVARASFADAGETTIETKPSLPVVRS
jgi:hypothetical protein